MNPVRSRRLFSGDQGAEDAASLSPVSDASAIINDAASTRRASAATASPSASNSTSPGTIWSDDTQLLDAVSHHCGTSGCHSLQSGDGLLGLGLLHIAEGCVE